MSKPIYLTKAGRTKLEQELKHLTTVKRREISKALEHARSLGDLRENAEYDAAKNEQAHLERRIAELTDTLGRSQLLEEGQLAADEVLIGATVTVKDMQAGGEERYTLVAAEEADITQGTIAVTSPIGKGLLRHKAGETVKIQVPAGTLTYTILKIER